MTNQYIQSEQSILFIDSGVSDYQTLLDGLKAGTKVVILDADKDGVKQIAAVLSRYSNVDSVHILSHGNPAEIYLGNTTLSQHSLITYQSVLRCWKQALSQAADILIYGCNVAKGAIGQKFIQQLSAITQANIASSVDLTGAEALGGNWRLTYHCGQVPDYSIFESSALQAYPGILATETITFAEDELSGEPLASYTKSTTSYGNLTIKGTDSGLATAFGSLTSLSNPGGLYDSLSQFGAGASVGIGLNDGSNGATVGTWFTFATANGGEFDLVSLKMTEGLAVFTTMEAVGFRGGVQIGTQSFSLTTGTINQVITMDSTFDNVDEVRIRQKTTGFYDTGTPGQDGVLYENFVFQPIPAPTITSATYNASTNSFVITGTNLVATGGATNDIDVSKLTLTGQGGATYTLTSSNVEIDSATQFTVTLNATDQINVEGLLNKNGTSAVDATTFNLAAAADWNPAQTGNADLTGNVVTVSNVQTPAITSATYDASTGVLTVTGTDLVKASGATNDITANTFTFTGEGGATYTLTDTSNVEITSGTSFSITLSSTDKAVINPYINKNGTSSTGGTTFNLAAADDWNTVIGDSNIADATSGITVSNVAAPAITNATYDYSTNVLVVTGTGFLNLSGVTNDIDISKFTFTGEGGATYTLTSASDVEIDSGTQFTVTLSGSDLTNVEGLLNKDGTSSADVTTYNLAAAEDWAAGADSVVTVADITGNGITVSNYTVPTITSATYNAGTGALVIAGTNFVIKSGATNDIDVSLLTFTGQGGSYALTDTSDVEITSATAAIVTLSATDLLNVNGLLNKNGMFSVDATTYNLAAAEDWMPGAPSANTIADLTGNGITVSNVQTPTITSATYDASTGVLTVTGSNLVKASGATNDITANTFTFTGEGGSTYTLTDSSDVEITAGSAFAITLSATDKAAINQILNKNGTASTSATTYNLAAGDDWNTVIGNADISDATNAITVSNVAVPTITGASYDYSTNTLVVTGSGFLKLSGASNDIDLSKLTFTGEGGATYTLTSASDVEIDSDTQFTVTLSGADLVSAETLLNQDGLSSSDSTTYNLAADEDWAAGADAAVNVVDATGNGITVSNYAAPAVTSATYDFSTGQLVVTGTNFVSLSGATNDIDASLFTFTGESGGTYTLTDTADVEITSATQFTLTLSATDKLNVHGLLNKDGTVSGDATTYNLSAAEDWMPGAPSANNIVDASGNGITVSNVAAPAITSATYDSDSGILVVSGTNLFKKSGASNDIDISTLTLTGGVANATYTITSASDVEITSATSFSLTLAGADKTNVDSLLDQIGTASSSGSTYNLAAADNWLTAADATTDISDAVNAVTVSINPKITSATYDASTGTLVVTGTNIQANGGGADIDVSKLTFAGEGGATYTLTDSSDVERDSASQFTVTLSATDKAAINQIANKAGTSSTGGTTYNLAAADDWDTNVTTGDTADSAGNGVTVSNVPAPDITSATYNANSGALVVTGTGFLKANGATNDIVANKFAFTAEDGESYTLTDTANVEITSGTAFTLTLSATDKTAINQIVNKNGTASTGGTTYNLAAAEDWAAGADASVNVVDATGNGITASNVAAPTITSATYNTGTGVLAVAGASLLKLTGANNDIDASRFTFTGLGSSNYTLTDTADVDISSATAFSLILSATDKAAVNALLDTIGTAASDTTTYNLAAAEDWTAGADTAVNVVDAAGNGITVTIPSTGGGGGTTAPPTTTTVDGTTVTARTETDGTTTLIVPFIDNARTEDPDSLLKNYADIPILTNNAGNPILTASLPVGVGMQVNGETEPMSPQDAIDDLTQRIEQETDADSSTLLNMTKHGKSFIDTLTANDIVSVQTITLTVSDNYVPGRPIIINGSDFSSDGKIALVIDVSQLPPKTVIKLDNIAFAAITGAVTARGGKGNNFVVLDEHKQSVVLGEGDDILFGGEGDDVIGSLSGNDQVTGDAGNDIVFGGTGQDILTGGAGNDMLNGGFGFDTAVQAGKMTDYHITVNGNNLILVHLNGDTDTLTDVELIQFEIGSNLAVAHTELEAVAHHLVKTWLGRDLTVDEGSAVQEWVDADSYDIVNAFLSLAEAVAFKNMTTDELLAGLDDNPNIIQLNVVRDFIGSDGNDQGYLSLDLALNVDGGNGHDVLQMQGSLDVVDLEQIGDTVEITQLDDGAMLNLRNAEMIAFDSGENILLAHNDVEGILGRLFQTFFDRDATVTEWQAGREALISGVEPDVFLNWFQTHASLTALSDTAYIQALYTQTLDRSVADIELNQQLTRLNNGEITRDWLAVDIAGSDEAVAAVGNVWMLDNSV